MSLIERIDTVCIKVRNIEEASCWYQDVLGLQEYYKEDHYVILNIGEGSIPLTLEKGVKVSDIQKDGLNFFFTFYDLDGNKLQVCFWE